MIKILVVDDDEEMRDVIAEFLRKNGYQVFIAGDGERALEVLRAEKPRLLVLDLTMPKKNGYMVCEAVRSDPDAEISGMKIIVTSGKKFPLDIRAAHEAKADDYLVKPYQTKELLAAIKELLG
jgi:DNA-binding response OmpR family regulator